MLRMFGILGTTNGQRCLLLPIPLGTSRLRSERITLTWVLSFSPALARAVI